MNLKTWLLAATALGFAGAAHAQTFTDGVDQDRRAQRPVGPLRRPVGAGLVWAARKAVEDFGAAAKGMKVEVVFADHQNKPDIGSNIARQWFDRDGVDAIVDVPTSSVALAVNQIAREKNKVFLNSGAATSDLTGKACSPNTVHWTYDTVALANGTGKAIVSTGGKSWFFLTADYAFGHALERDTKAVVRPNGGNGRGQGAPPLPGHRLLRPSCSRPRPRRPRSSGWPTRAATRSTRSSRRPSSASPRAGRSLAGLLVFLSDVHALGLRTAQGLIMTEAWYWDQNDNNRAFAKEFRGRQPGQSPDHGAGRRLLGRDPLSQGARSVEERRATAPPWSPR
jgi:branched-chain amino acid transport system substrate-binding protein